MHGFERVRVTVNGKPVKVRRAGRHDVRVSLRGRPKARYRIRIRARTSNRRTITDVRVALAVRAWRG